MEKLESYLEDKGIEAEFHEFSESTLTVDDSAELLDIEPDRIVKSLVFKDEEDEFLMAIVPGNSRVDESKLSEVHGFEVKMAKAREVENRIGYKIGEVPPVSHGLKTYIDEASVEYETVVAGGGSTHVLMEFSSDNIKELNDSVVCDITE